MKSSKVRWNLKEVADRRKFQRNRKTGLKAYGTVRGGVGGGGGVGMKWQKEKGGTGDEVRRSSWG